jgi:hypothetical protein
LLRASLALALASVFAGAGDDTTQNLFMRRIPLTIQLQLFYF